MHTSSALPRDLSYDYSALAVLASALTAAALLSMSLMPCRYSDLLPSSDHLSKVVLRDTHSMLPNPSYGCHIFPPGRQLPALCEFIFGWDVPAGDVMAAQPEELPPPIFEHLSITRMAASCPALEVLLLPGCLTQDVQLAPLLQLTALTDLLLAGEEIDDALVSDQLVMLTGLESLQIHLSPELTDTGVLSLTALTELQSLFLFKCGISEELSEPANEGVLDLGSDPVCAGNGVAVSYKTRQQHVYVFSSHVLKQGVERSRSLCAEA
jgi:hypothetical protein